MPLIVGQAGSQEEGVEFRDHPCFDSCAEFCERWDQSSFDPDYDTLPLEHFEPMVREVFGRKAHDPAVIREGHVSPLTAA